jgi:ABC-type branched-subunit amino acid transport system substrate-binding protein
LNPTSLIRTAVALAATGAILVLAGCAGASGTEEAGVPAPSGAPLKLMGVAAVGAALSNYPDVEAGARAAVKAINDAGGVAGHPIEYSFCNTNGDANKAAECLREAVDEDVAAVVGRADIFSETTTGILEAAGIPDLGIFATGAMADATSPMSFPMTSGNFGTYLAAGYVAEAIDASSMAIVAVDVALAHTQADLAAAAAADAGYDDVEIIYVPAQGVTDYSPFAQQLADTGADLALTMLGPARNQAFYKATDALGVEAQLLTTAYSFSDAEAQATGSAANGTWVTSTFPDPLDTSNPAIAVYDEQLTAAGYGDDPSLRRPAGLNAWLAVHAAALVAEGIEGDITSTKMLEALAATTDLDVEGIVVWSPSALSESGSFARLPASPISVLEFVDGGLEPVDMPEIPDPLASLR